MSKFISSNELWEQLSQKFSSSNNQRGKSELSFEKDYGMMKIHHYNTGFGIKYFSITGFFQEDIIIENTNLNASNFICINNGSSIYMEDRIKKQKR